MSLLYRQHEKVKLRDLGYDERWLQNQIADDPSILGLGDVILRHKERKQSGGGRLDIVLSDPDSETIYEVEIMLGATDPSHIIRTIEYWDIETRRYPNTEHRAVLVAEEITNRFFNVIWLLNRSIPIIAIQLDVLRFDETFLLHFTKILDIHESPESITEEPDEVVNHEFWERRSSPEAMVLLNEFKSLIDSVGIKVKYSYRQDGIAIAGKRNFASIIPRKSGWCLLNLRSRLPQDLLIESRKRFEEAGVSVKKRTDEGFSVQLDSVTLRKTEDIVKDLMRIGATSDLL